MVRAIPAVIMALALAACSTSGGSAPTAASSSPSLGDKVANLVLLGDANPPPAAASAEKVRVFCPELAIQPGTASLELYERGHEGDPFSQRYQARFGHLARACDANSQTVTIRIGVAGRVVVGPKGQSGQTLTLPIRLVLLDAGNKPVFSRLEQVPVAIPAGTGGADFSRVVTSEPIPLPADRMSGWRLKIGFDTGPAAKSGHGARHRRSHRGR